MPGPLTCDGCGTTAGLFESYEAWSDAASALGWVVGEDVVICPACGPTVSAGDPASARRASTA